MVKCKRCQNDFERLYNGDYSDYDNVNGTDTQNLCNDCVADFDKFMDTISCIVQDCFRVRTRDENAEIELDDQKAFRQKAFDLFMECK